MWGSHLEEEPDQSHWREENHVGRESGGSVCVGGGSSEENVAYFWGKERN